MVEQAIVNAIDALKRRDKVAARQAYEGDEQINEKRHTIENRVLILMATQ
jgi:phosphate uptake regulator